MRNRVLSLLVSVALIVTSLAGGLVASKQDTYAATFKITAPLNNSLKPAGNITIKWNAATENINKYEVYVDDAKVGETTKTSYDYYSTKVINHTVFVKAILSGGGSSETPKITFFVSKKGLGLATDMGASIDLHELGCSWYYNWGEGPSAGEQYAGIDYVPMVWKETNAANFKNRVNSAISKGYKEILTFNEPDLGGQCDMPVDDVYNVWQGIDGFDGDIRISSPVTALWPKASGGWFQPFMSKLNDSDYKPDFISIHCYPENYAGAGMANWFVEEIVDWTWNTYHLPIWITEFSTTGGGVTATGGNGTKEFWETVMPLLDQRDYVERYAAFGFNADNSPNVGLWKYSNGELTAGGNVYKTLGTPAGYDYKNVAEGDYKTTIGSRNTLLDNSATINGTTYTDLVEQGATITASSQKDNNAPANAIDNSITSRWESQEKVDPQTVTLDLGSVKSIKQVDVVWEGASAAKYQIEVSTDGVNYEQVAEVTSGNGARWDKTILTDMAVGRYIRLNCIARTTNYGYSIYDMAVYGSTEVVTTTQPTTAEPTTVAPTTAAPTTTQVVTTAEPTTTQILTTAEPTTQAITQKPTTQPTTQKPTEAVTTVDPGVYGDVRDTDTVKALLTSAANIAKGKTAVASSTTTPNGYQPGEAVDGNLGSMWGAATSGKNEWLAIDLGEATKIDSVAIAWEGAYAKQYDVQVSSDGINYTTVRSVTATSAETLQLTMPNNTVGRYVRIYANEPGTGWEMKIYEVGVFGSKAGSVETTVAPTTQAPTTTQVPTTVAPTTAAPSTTVAPTTRVQDTTTARQTTTQQITTTRPAVQTTTMRQTTTATQTTTLAPNTTAQRTTTVAQTTTAVPGDSSNSVVVDGTKVMWHQVDGAVSYNIYINGEAVASTTSLEYDLSSQIVLPGEYMVEVRSVSASGMESSIAKGFITKAETSQTVKPSKQQTTTAIAKVKIKKATKKKSAKKLVIKIKKIAGVKGYQVAVYKTKKNAKKNKKALFKKLIKKNKSKLTVKNKKLKKKKKLYVRVRAYKQNPGKVYGSWSAVKKVKIK